MISTLHRIVCCALLLTCSNSAPIRDITTVESSRQQVEFIDGEVVCTGHLLEDNFEDNLAAAAESK